MSHQLLVLTSGAAATSCRKLHTFPVLSHRTGSNFIPLSGEVMIYGATTLLILAYSFCIAFENKIPRLYTNKMEVRFHRFSPSALLRCNKIADRVQTVH